MTPMHLIQNKRKSYGPYEMLYFGKYIGHRFLWNKKLFLEIFPITPAGLCEYADLSIFKTYPQIIDEPHIDFDAAESTEYLIINNELIGCYIYKAIDKSKTLNVLVWCIASKLNNKIVRGILSELQDLAKAKQLQSIWAEFDYPAVAYPGEIPDLKANGVDLDAIMLNIFEYSTATTIPDGTRPQPIDALSEELQYKMYVDCKKLMYAFELCGRAVSFALRDNHTYEFLGAAITRPHPNAVNICSLDQFVLDPALRGKKHGSAMLKLLERSLIAANVNNIILTTNDYMVPGFYKKNSYKIYGSTQKNNYLFGKRLVNNDGTPGSKPRLASPLRLL